MLFVQRDAIKRESSRPMAIAAELTRRGVPAPLGVSADPGVMSSTCVQPVA